MPYRVCPRCRLATFSAARQPGADECPRCGAELDSKPAPLFRDRVRAGLNTKQRGTREQPHREPT